MMLLNIVAAAALLMWPLSRGDVLFASLQHDQNLATRIHCRVEEEEHFRYSSETALWGRMGGTIWIEADIAQRCIGADLQGKYGSEALKYNIRILRLKVREGTQRESVLQRRRRKRGAAREFFSNSWRKVKNFFNRMLGRRQETSSTPDPEVSDDHEPDEVNADEMYGVPFQLVQLGNGSIPEIRFSENEVEDGRVRNFKRHLADVFSTRLHLHPVERELEMSIMGEHTSSYRLSVTGGETSDYVASTSGGPPPEEGERVVVVNKVTTTDDIVRFAPSDALNHKDGMSIKSEQTQMFRGGRMTSSRGVSSFSLVHNTTSGGRERRDTDGDATSYIRTESFFDLQLRRRRSRRSVDSSELWEDHSFRSSSRTAEVEDVRDLANEESVDLRPILDDLMTGRDTEDKILLLREVMRDEIDQNLDEENNSFCSAIRNTLTPEVVEEMCAKNFAACKDYLQLIALAGGPTAEQLFLRLVGNFSHDEVLVDIFSDISRPSTHLLTALIEMVDRRGGGGQAWGALAISLGHMASAHPLRERVSDLFTEILLTTECHDPRIIDLLEAVGNLKCDRITPRILEVWRRCGGESAVQIAILHALRRSPLPERWFETFLEEGDCDVRREAVGSLIDRIQEQEMAPSDSESWPLHHFNAVDDYLRGFVSRGECPSEDILIYFSKKKNAEANEISNAKRRRKKRRASWNDLKCEEWTQDSVYNPIQPKEEFDSDRSTFNKRKSCLAFRKLGVKGANAEIYAGMFAGLKEPSDPPQYKLFTKFVSGFNFLGQQVEVGSFYFYLYSGKTKAYVRIMGRTRQQFTNDGCTPTELQYRPLKHIPLYMVSIGSVQVSLGIHLSSRLSVDTLCPVADVYQLQPLTDVRIGGEAVGSVGLIRGGANLGANFNYKLQFTFTPTPNMCLKGSHGFDPMNINFESYFQLWNQVRKDWGKTRVWKPSFMSWELKRGELKQWFDDTCIALQQAETLNSSEREIE